MLKPLTRREPGGRFYLTQRSPTDPCKFFLYEQSNARIAIEAHRAVPCFVEHAINAALYPMLSPR